MDNFLKSRVIILNPVVIILFSVKDRGEAESLYFLFFILTIIDLCQMFCIAKDDQISRETEAQGKGRYRQVILFNYLEKYHLVN